MTWLTNIQAAWLQVSDLDLELGKRAYPTYHSILRGLAAHYDAPFVQTVEAFSALSPNSDYHGNLRSIATLLNGRKKGADVSELTVSTYNACRDRAWQYLIGEVSFLDTVKGRKIRAFRDNILYLNKSALVTCDGHMICIAEGASMPMTAANAALRQRGLYDAVELAVKKVARREGLGPCEVQATLWTWRKRSLGVKFDTQLNLFTNSTLWDAVLQPEEILPYD